MDINQRKGLTLAAMRAAIEDQSLIPLHTRMTAIAARRHIVYAPRADEWTMAMQASPASR